MLDLELLAPNDDLGQQSGSECLHLFGRRKGQRDGEAYPTRSVEIVTSRAGPEYSMGARAKEEREKMGASTLLLAALQYMQYVAVLLPR